MEIQETVEKKTTEYIIDISKVSVFFSSILFFYKSVLLFCNNVMGAKVYISIPEADDIALLRCLQISIVLHLADGKRRVWCCQTKNWHRYASKKRQRIWKKSLFFLFASRTMRFCAIYCFRDFYADYCGRMGTKVCWTKLNEVKENISTVGYGVVICEQ